MSERRDPLLEAYERASALDEARPSPALREAVLAQAARAAQATAAPPLPPARGLPEAIVNRPAANHGAWYWRAAAGLVLGIVGVWMYRLGSAPTPEANVAQAPVAAPSRSTESGADAPSQTAEIAASTAAGAPPPPAAEPRTTVASAAASRAPAARTAAQAKPAATETSVAVAAPPPPPAPAAAARARAAPPPPASAAAPPPEPFPADTRVAAAPQASVRAPTAPAAAAPFPSASVAAAPAAASEAPSEDRIALAESAKRAVRPRSVAPAASETAAVAEPPAQAARSGDMTPSMRQGMANAALFAALRSGEVQAVRSAMARGADVNARDEHGRTPLQIAREGNHVEIIRLLEAAGAKP